MSSRIQWTDETWNPTVGCTRASKGCDNCYAVRHTQRLAGKLPLYQGLVNAGKRHFNGVVRTAPERLEVPLRWKRPRKVFVNSLSDLFHPDVPFEFIDQVFAVMAACPQHIFQILTKRPERMSDYQSHAEEAADYAASTGVTFTWPLPNCWLGTSVEDQEAADERIPHLLRTTAAVRFLSCEPLLGPIELRQSWRDYLEGWETEGECCGRTDGGMCCMNPEPVQVQTARVDWVIVGGESGPGARPCNLAWIAEIIEQCQETGVAVFNKQLGSHPYRREFTAHEDHLEVHPPEILELKHRKGGDIEEWPEHLRVREYPSVEGSQSPPI